jgi:hypothetical protein
MNQPVEVTLANIAGGALMECVSAELKKICDNILDPNCKAEAKRKLQINIVFDPNDKRSMVGLTYEVKSTLIGPDSGKTMSYLAADEEGNVTLFEVETHPPLFPPQGVQTSIPDLEPLPAKRA